MIITVFVIGVAIGAAASWLLVDRVRRRVDDVVVAETVAPPVASTGPDGRLLEALDALAVGLVVSDAGGDVIYRNRVAAGPTGTVHADVLVEEAVQKNLRAVADGSDHRQILELFGPPRAVVVVTASPLSDGGAVVTVEDVSERSRLDAVRTDFVANVSHELKTPVGAIAVLAEALVDEDDPEIVRRFVAKMQAEAHRVGRTIDDLLELSRIELGGEPVRQPTSVGAVVDEAVERVSSLAAGQGIGIATEVSPCTVFGDVRQLVSAVGNLVENAVKYSDEGSVVTVRAATVGEMVEIAVVDTGVGIPTKDIDRVFERFYRVDRARSRATGGTGLGLSIVRHVATNHGGDVTVHSREGEGSTFVLRLPSASTSAEPRSRT